jgi:hypothetical protein
MKKNTIHSQEQGKKGISFTDTLHFFALFNKPKWFHKLSGKLLDTSRDKGTKLIFVMGTAKKKKTLCWQGNWFTDPRTSHALALL